MFINIGNKAFVNADKIKFIVGADAECDSTSAKETRSMLIMDDNSVGISSVNSTILANRANATVVEAIAKE